MKTGLTLPLPTRIAIASGQKSQRRTLVFVQYPSGQWVGVAETTQEHRRAVAAAEARGWDGSSRMELANRAGVLYAVMPD